MASLYLLLLAVLLLISKCDCYSKSYGSCSLDLQCTYHVPDYSNSSCPPSDGKHPHPPPPQNQSVPAHPPVHPPSPPKQCAPSDSAVKLFKCCYKFQAVAAEFLSMACFGQTVYQIDETVYRNSTTTVSGQKVWMSDYVTDILQQITYQSIKHLKAVNKTMYGNCSWPSVDISPYIFQEVVDRAFEYSLWPPFNPYAKELNVLLTAYYYQGLITKCFIGILDNLNDTTTKRLGGSLAAAKAMEESTIRNVLYEKKEQLVGSYGVSVAEFTDRLSRYKDQLLNTTGTCDAGLWFPQCDTQGYGGNLFSVDQYGLPFSMNGVDINCTVAKSVLGASLMDSE